MRREGWQAMLDDWCKRRHGEAFEWGRMDCALLCAEAVDVITGTQLAAAFRGRWATQRSAINYQRRLRTDLVVELNKAGAFRWQGQPLLGDIIVHPYQGFPGMFSGYVCFGLAAMSANPEQGVYLCETTAAMAQPGAFVMRIA